MTRNPCFPSRALCTARSISTDWDEKSVLPVSSLMYGAFDIDGLALSMPAIVGRNGVECLVPLEMSEDELDELRKTAATVKAIVDDVFGEAK